MNSKSVVAVVALILVLLPCHAQNQVNKTDSVIKGLERELELALSKDDIATLDRILVDDYVQIDAQGGVTRKAKVIELTRMRAAAPRGVMIGPEKTVDELTIRSYGDSALVFGRTTIRYQFMEDQTSPSQAPAQNPVTINQERFIRSYAKVGGRWQLVAWQITAIAKR
ncbi:MAG TPA: nuclear transport factor 2 family protein [Pyrinomonadaceae bacterium]|nr:nuclear transport factor 2 family protein [Pyrinomonadaceae bacterium]